MPRCRYIQNKKKEGIWGKYRKTSLCGTRAQSHQTLWDPMDCSPPGSSVHGISQARILEWVAISYSRGSSHPRDWTQDSHIAGAGRFFTSWATKEAQSLPLLQEIFPTWESDQGLLHWRQVLYQLSYQGKPHLMLAKRPHFLYGDCVFNGIGIARSEGTI